ncbi:MAG TPA: phosphatase PAP2 family protein [Terracidiphilus sp.]|jgi:membrane-associated phospholipid phosphatase|nr:phosphatase PAP2 family protein [Terracidiphilus sp.]
MACVSGVGQSEGSACVAQGRPDPPQQRQICALTRLDYAGLGAVALLLFPAYFAARLPFRIDLGSLTSAYWGGTAVESIFAAVVLSIIGLPLSATLTPLAVRLNRNKILIVLMLTAAVWMTSWFGPRTGLALTVDAIAVAELMTRKERDFGPAVLDLLIPALYLFCVILLVFALNHAIVGIEYAGTYDLTFERIDRQLFHMNVSSIAQWSQSHLSRSLLAVLQFIYFGLYRRIGAALILTALLTGQRHAVRHVRTIFVAYMIAVALFFALPAKGPYSLHPTRPQVASASLPTITTQGMLASKAKLLWAHDDANAEARTIDLEDYFISFPSMHIALPLIGIWFLRRYKRMALCLLVAYVTMLVPSTIVLGWHYFVDVLGGFMDAAMAIQITAYPIGAPQNSALVEAPTAAQAAPAEA